MQDPFARRCEFAIQEAVSRGIRPLQADPPAHRLLRKFGFRLRPPHYRSFSVNILSFGWFFGAVWGIWMWFWVWSKNNMPITVAVIVSIGAGLFFGAVMAAAVVWKRRKTGLSRWDDLPS